MPPSQRIENQPIRPRRLVGLASTVSDGEAAGTGVPAGGAAPGRGQHATHGRRARSAAGSGMTDPGVDDGVEHVHGEVHEDVEDGEHGHEALQGDVLALEDGLADGEAHARDAEDDLDDHRRR